MEAILLILLMIMFSGFFSGMEIAFISSNKLRFELEKKQNRFPSRLVGIFMKKPSQYIATMLVGNNISLVVYGILMSILLEPFILEFTNTGLWVILVQTLISTIIILFLAEFLPKIIFRINANLWLNFFALPLAFFYYLLYPLSVLTIGISNILLGLFFGKDPNKEKKQAVFNKVDLNDFIAEGQDENQENNEIENEIRLFQNALDFSKVKLRECMVPRTEIEALEVGEDVEALRKRFSETGYSRIIIYKESIDEVLGYIHTIEMFKNPDKLNDCIVKIPYVPETMPANKLLESFIKENKSMAVVVDEFGGTSGIVTIEDIMEEIFGEIEDEHDVAVLTERKISDKRYIFSGRLEIDYLNEKYKLNLPRSEEYETLAGLILYHHEDIPMQNEVIELEGFKLGVMRVEDNVKIEMVSLTIEDKD